MEQQFSYRQDTTGAIHPLRELPGLSEPGELIIDRSAPVPLIPVTDREAVEEHADTVQQLTPSSPTQAQLRYWWWQREKNLMIEDSRYMKPLEADRLGTVTIWGKEGFSLPTRSINSVSTDWLTLVLLLALILFASVRTIWGKYLGYLFQSVLNYSTADRLFREKNYSVLHGAVRLELLFYLVISIFLFQVAAFYRLEFSYKNFLLYLMGLGIVIFYYFFKKSACRFLGFLSENSAVAGEFLFNMDNYNRVTGLLLLPVVAVIAFYPFHNVILPLTIGAIVCGIIYFLLLSRGFIIIIKKQFSIFYLFLYFCTLEILPLVLLYKILVM